MKPVQVLFLAAGYACSNRIKDRVLAFAVALNLSLVTFIIGASAAFLLARSVLPPSCTRKFFSHFAVLEGDALLLLLLLLPLYGCPVDWCVFGLRVRENWFCLASTARRRAKQLNALCCVRYNRQQRKLLRPLLLLLTYPLKDRFDIYPAPTLCSIAPLRGRRLLSRQDGLAFSGVDIFQGNGAGRVLGDVIYMT